MLVILVLAGFYFANEQKQHTLDEQRAHDVLSLSWRIVEYDHIIGVLPTSLEKVAENDKEEIPRDPEDGQPYEYKRIGKKTFRLCAVFSRQSNNFPTVGSRALYGDPITHGYGTWSHGQGRQCIDRTVPNYR
jgi:hypothetical protein